MEAAAVAWAAELYQVPYFALKVVTDIGAWRRVTMQSVSGYLTMDTLCDCDLILIAHQTRTRICMPLMALLSRREARHGGRVRGQLQHGSKAPAGGRARRPELCAWARP